MYTLPHEFGFMNQNLCVAVKYTTHHTVHLTNRFHFTTHNPVSTKWRKHRPWGSVGNINQLVNELWWIKSYIAALQGNYLGLGILKIKMDSTPWNGLTAPIGRLHQFFSSLGHLLGKFFHKTACPNKLITKHTCVKFEYIYAKSF